MVLFGAEAVLQSDHRVAVSNSPGISEFGSRHHQCEAGGVRRLAYEAADAGLLSPELAAGIRRVKGSKRLGVRSGNWLTAEQARSLWQLPSAGTLKSKRDRAILAVLLGCGLRRRELSDHRSPAEE